MGNNDHSTTAASVFVDISEHVQLRVLKREGGDRVPFLFVHGLASNARLWDGVAEHVAAAGHDSIAVDLRGHGGSSQVSSGFDFRTMADDLAAVVARISTRPVVAVGQSWGGNVALEFAERHPHLVVALSLIDGGFLRLRDDLPDWAEAERLLMPPSLDGMTSESVATMMRSRLEGFPEAGIESQLENFIINEDGSVENRLRLKSHLTILRHLWDHDPDPVGANVTSPVQVIAVAGGMPNKQDRVAAFAAAAAAEVHWVDGHHDVHAQQPERVAELLLAHAERAKPWPGE